MRGLLGLFIILSPLWLMFIAVVVESGWVWALISFGASFLIVGVFGFGIYLLVTEFEKEKRLEKEKEG